MQLFGFMATLAEGSDLEVEVTTQDNLVDFVANWRDACTIYVGQAATKESQLERFGSQATELQSTSTD